MARGSEPLILSLYSIAYCIIMGSGRDYSPRGTQFTASLPFARPEYLSGTSIGIEGFCPCVVTLCSRGRTAVIAAHLSKDAKASLDPFVHLRVASLLDFVNTP